MQELSKYFSMPEKAVAKQLGVCLTSLKKICRQNGINRWPYRKIKSLDKKLRKLDAAMTHAKDDVSMLRAMHYTPGCARWSDASDQPGAWGADSPFLCPTDESNAVTPRYSATSPSGSGSLTPAHLWEQAPFPSARARPAAAHREHVAAEGRGQARGSTGNVAAQGPKDVVGHAAACSALKESATSVVKTETQDESGTSGVPASQSPQELSDDELIAMLAECAAKPAGACHEDFAAGNCHENFAQVLSERMSAVADELQQMQQSDSETSLADDGTNMVPGDEALMAALANCCGGHSPFEEQPGDFDANGCNVETKGASNEQAKGNSELLSLSQAACDDSSLWLDDDGPQLLWQH